MPDPVPLSGEKSLSELVAHVGNKAQSWFARNDQPHIAVSPYRFNPLGAHIDHQGGAVMARTIDQYTVLAFYPADDDQVTLVSELEEGSPVQATFGVGETETDSNWIRYAMASVASNAGPEVASRGFSGYVLGTLVGAGLSSSASVILAYVAAMARCNSIDLSPADMVEKCRQVENNFMGLNNGLQDQMSVVFGRADALSILDVNTVSAQYVADPPGVADVSWVLCYSGFSRELVSSGFNDRVAECRQAANLLDSSAHRLGDVAVGNCGSAAIDQLPAHLGRRARHVYSEMQRVRDGAEAWRAADWERFGELMNLSCESSIQQYECGSEPMVALQNIALAHSGVIGSRFSGGGYGGCLNMLTTRQAAVAVCEEVLDAFLGRYPEKRGIARAFVAGAEDNVRVIEAS